MKKFIPLIGIATFLFLPPFLPRALSHGASGETSRAQIGEDFAVIAFDPQKGFQLGAAAKTRMKLKAQALSHAINPTIPLAALVEVRGATEVFRIRDGWVSRVPVKVLGEKGVNVTVQGVELKEGDEIVIQGAPLLRVTEMDLSAGLKDEHPVEEKHEHPEPKGHHHGDGEVHHHD